MKRQRHRVVVEISTSKPITEKEAVAAMNLILQRVDKEAKPIWANALNIYATRLMAKSFTKVLATIKN